VTVVPEVPLGTAKVQLNAPVAPELIDVETTVPSVNPVPETVTDTPFGPCIGVSVTAGTVTVNDTAVVDALVATSSPTTLYDPADSLGTLNVHVNVPLALVVIVVPLAVPAVHPVALCNTPSNATVADDDTEKPLPVTVYVAPTGP